MKDKELIESKQLWLLEATASYCQDQLNEEYKCLCEKLINKMARKRTVPFLNGKLEIWAASVVYAIGQINFLFDKSFEPYASADDICDYFGVKKSTITNKAKEIRDMFKMHNWDAEFGTEDMKRSDPFGNMVMVNGIPIPKHMLPPEIQELLKS